jgi:hypothetical protein
VAASSGRRGGAFLPADPKATPLGPCTPGRAAGSAAVLDTALSSMGGRARSDLESGIGIPGLGFQNRRRAGLEGEEQEVLGAEVVGRR